MRPPDQPTTGFGLLLADWMKCQECTHARAALRLGVHRATIYRWLQGRSEPPASRLYHIARVMGEDEERLRWLTGRVRRW